MSAQPGLHQQPMAQPQQQNGEWQNGLFDCFSNPHSEESPNLCLKAFCCSCFTYGRTQARLNDPSMSGYNSFNMDCCLFCGASYLGVACLFPLFARGEIRKRFSLSGDTLGDFLRACCCPCCSLIQNEKEVVYHSLQGSQQGYKSVQGMHAGPQ